MDAVMEDLKSKWDEIKESIRIEYKTIPKEKTSTLLEKAPEHNSGAE